MEIFLKETSFHGVMLDKMFAGSCEWKKKLHVIVSEGIAAGVVRPLSRTVFADTEVEQAFRYSCDGDKLVRLKEISR
jgi:fatty acid synthase